MKRKIFTKATPRAAEGIRRTFEAIGAKVTAVVNPQTGRVTVAVDIPERNGERVGAWLRFFLKDWDD